MDDLKTLRATVAAIRAAPQGDRLRAACAVVGMPIGEVRAHTRSAKAWTARRIVATALYVGTDLSFVRIAILMERDHSTIYNNIYRLARSLGWTDDTDLREWWGGLQAADAQHQKLPLRIVA